MSFNNYRYHCLGYEINERVVANRESCRILLVRLKMDGWALGKTKVFLKYYHIEYLSRLFEKYIRSIVVVQSCVRRWLAKVRASKEKWLMAQSALTLQKCEWCLLSYSTKFSSDGTV